MRGESKVSDKFRELSRPNFCFSFFSRANQLPAQTFGSPGFPEREEERVGEGSVTFLGSFHRNHCHLEDLFLLGSDAEPSHEEFVSDFRLSSHSSCDTTPRQRGVWLGGCGTAGQ